MKRAFDEEFNAVRNQLLEMGALVEKAIAIALAGITGRDRKVFDGVFTNEKIINQMHVDIDEKCLRLLALQSPVAAKLRLVVSMIKINNDLERMGDLSINLAHNGARYISEPALAPLIDIPAMASEVQLMVRESLAAFTNSNVELARTVLGRDDTVDRFKHEITKELVEDFMIKDSTTIRRALDLILIARNLERIADHATNIAEDAIFVVSGSDVRHGKRTIPPTGTLADLLGSPNPK